MMPKTPFSTRLSGSAKVTERRIRNIFQGPKKRPPIPVLILGALLILFCGSLVSCRIEDAAAISPLPDEKRSTNYPLASWTDWSGGEISFTYEETRGREDILLEYGFQDAPPYYTYSDSGNLRLELYYSAETETGCGFFYGRRTGEGFGLPEVSGFAFRLIDDWEQVRETDVWSGTKPYSHLSVYGTDGSDLVSDYQESLTDGDTGGLKRFLSTGVLNDFPQNGTATILDIEFERHSDGSLTKRYSHSSLLFGTTYTPSTLRYDWKERLMYATSYITHGSLEYYYLYETGASHPSYCLYLDHDAGLCGAQLLRCGKSPAYQEPETSQVAIPLDAVSLLWHDPMEYLTEEQKALMSHLPAEDLPREPVDLLNPHRSQFWRDTLIPLAADEAADVTLYGVVGAETFSDLPEPAYDQYVMSQAIDTDGIVLRCGDRTAYFPLVWEGNAWCGGNPWLEVADFDGDGAEEAAVCLFSGHGTGVSVYDLYLFELDTLTYTVPDWSTLDISVTFDPLSRTALLSGGGQSLTVDLSEDWDPAWEPAPEVYCGSYIHFFPEDGQLFCDTYLHFTGMGYLAHAVLPVTWSEGRYRLGPAAELLTPG